MKNKKRTKKKIVIALNERLSKKLRIKLAVLSTKEEDAVKIDLRNKLFAAAGKRK